MQKTRKTTATMGGLPEERSKTPVTRRSVNAVTPPRLPKARSWRSHGVHGAPCDWGIRETEEEEQSREKAIQNVTKVAVQQRDEWSEREYLNVSVLRDPHTYYV